MTIFGSSIRVIWREEDRREEEEGGGGGGRREEEREKKGVGVGGRGKRRRGRRGNKRKKKEEKEVKINMYIHSPLTPHLYYRMTVDLNNLVVSLWKQELAHVNKQKCLIAVPLNSPLLVLQQSSLGAPDCIRHCSLQ